VHPPQAPVYYARAADWTVRPSPWATVEDDDLADEGTYAPAEEQPPPPPVQTQLLEDTAAAPAAVAPPQRRRSARQSPEPVPAPGMSSATAWWIAVGVIVVALAVAAGVLVGLNLAQRSGPAGASGAMAEISLAAYPPS
jgi:hypothetical protein